MDNTSSTFNDANAAFFADFMKSISSEPDEEPQQQQQTCLITHEPLEKYSIRLNCGHFFNYQPLLNAIDEYKRDFKHNNNSLNDKMATYCPYCREKTNGLLPYVSGFNKIEHVNSPCSASFGSNTCSQIMTTKKICGRQCYFEKCHLHIHHPDITKCKGVTKAGNPCKNNATSVEIYCKLHRK